MATTLSDLLVRLDLDSAKFRDGLDKANKSLDKLNDKVGKMSDGMAASVFKGIASWDLLSNAASAAFNVISQGVKDFAEAEQRAFQLGNAIEQLGYNTEELLQPLLDQADAFEATTLASSEQVVAIQQLLLQYGIAPRDIERTTAAILDYSAATGKDAIQATQKLGKSLIDGNQEVNALGVEMKVTGDAGKDLATVLDAVNSKFGGQAEAAAKGMAGSIHRLSDAWGDLLKQVGSFFAMLEEKTGLMARFTKGLSNITAMLGGTPEHIKTQQRISELVEERIEMEKVAERAFLQSSKERARERIDAINEEIRLLQKKSAAEIKAGAAHGVGPDALAGVGVSPEAAKLAGKSAADKAKEDEEKERKKAAEEALRQRRIAQQEAEREAKRQADAAIALTLKHDPWAAYLDGLKELEKLADKISPATFEAEKEELYKKYFDELGKSTAEAAKGVNEAFIADVKKDIEALPPLPAVEIQKTFMQKVGDALNIIGDAISQAAMDFAGSLGGGAAVVATATQRLASGDWIGAILGMFMELFQNFDGFGRLINQSLGMLMGWVELLAPTFQMLLDATRPLLGAISFLVGTLIQLLQPIMDALIPVLESITPIIMVIAMLLKALEPAFEFLALVIKGVVTVIDVIVRGVFIALQGIGIVLLSIALGVVKVWNSIISAIQKVFRALGDIEIFDFHPLGFLRDWANGMEKAKGDAAGLSRALDDLTNTNYDAAQAKAEETAAVDEATGAITKMSEALLGVPQIFKVVQARFRAATPELRISRDLGAIPHFAEGGLVTRSTLALIGEGGEQEVVSPESLMRTIVREEGGAQTFIFNVMAGTGRELYEQFKRLVQRDNFTQTGFTVVGG